MSIAGSAVFALYLVVTLLIPVVIVLGFAPDLDPALYFAVIVLILVGAGWSLMGLVYQSRRASSA
jgi:L-asparagine transporter-like permease